MTLYAALDQYEFNRYDFGDTINFIIYQNDRKTVFDLTGYTVTLKSFKRHGDHAFFFRDVAKALTVIGQMAQIINDIEATVTDATNGVGNVAYTQTARPTIPGHMWLVLQLTKSGAQISTKPVRVYVHASEAQ